MDETNFLINSAQNDLTSFCIFTDQGASNPFRAYNPRPFHIQIADHLEKVFSGEIKKLIISLPPQHGKSTATSINGIAWMLGKDPTIQVALASYGSDLAQGFSQKCRDLMRTKEYINVFGDILKKDSQAKNERYTEKGGRYTAVGIGGPLTGKPVDLLLIDDYLKDSEEANSKLMKDKIWERYNTVALSRLHIESKQIIIATRWAEDDLIGRVLEVDGENRTQLIIPCYDSNGQAIRPERHPKELLESKRKLDEKTFQTLYMCNPLPDDGVYFKRDWFEYFHPLEINLEDYEICTFVDPAISQDQKADNTAIVTCGRHTKNNMIYVLDIDFGKFMPDDIINKVFQKVSKYKPMKVGIETNQFQKMLEIELRKQMRERNAFFVLDGQMSMGNKEAKIKTVLQSRYSNHSILHQTGGKDVNELENELLRFPNGKHDDIIDCLAMCISLFDAYQKKVEYKFQSKGLYNLDGFSNY